MYTCKGLDLFLSPCCRPLLNRCVTLVGGASMRFPRRLELKEESLMSDATLAESESRSSLDSALLEGWDDGLRFQPPTAWNTTKRDTNSWFLPTTTTLWNQEIQQYKYTSPIKRQQIVGVQLFYRWNKVPYWQYELFSSHELSTDRVHTGISPWGRIRQMKQMKPLTSLLLLLLWVYWQAANNFTAYTATRSPRPEVPGVGDWLQ